MPVKITRVNTSEDIDIVAELAKEIWEQHFTPIIGAAQVEYMLNRFQSADAVTSQIDSGYEYYLAWIGTEPVGYTGLVADTASGKLMISKIYVRQSLRGRGVGKSLLEFIERKCSLGKYPTLWLTVNRFNDATVEWYKHRHFAIVDEVKKDIGGGFIMDDYIMEKKIGLLA